MQNKTAEISASNKVAARYQALVLNQGLERDEAQSALVEKLDALINKLEAQNKPRPLLARLGLKFGSLQLGNAPASVPKGLYIWGSVGRGKTMLMDEFYACLPDYLHKRRAHFHAFMSEVHQSIHEQRLAMKEGRSKASDPVKPVAEAIAAEVKILCFDEFHVSDIADAMLLGRLFQTLFEHGVVLVATSNVAPLDLYKGGLNRALFLPFIALLNEKVETFRLDARTDFRLEKLGGSAVYLSPLTPENQIAIGTLWQKLTSNHVAAQTLTVKGRKFPIARAGQGAAFFTFQELCEQPLGASDYLALAQHFHTILLEHIPAMNLSTRNATKRFITLIDVLYEHRVKFIATAEKPVTELYPETEGREAFEFERTISRLIEMRSEEYLSAPHGRIETADQGKTTGLVET